MPHTSPQPQKGWLALLLGWLLSPPLVTVSLPVIIWVGLSLLTSFVPRPTTNPSKILSSYSSTMNKSDTNGSSGDKTQTTNALELESTLQDREWDSCRQNICEAHGLKYSSYEHLKRLIFFEDILKGIEAPKAEQNRLEMQISTEETFYNTQEDRIEVFIRIMDALEAVNHVLKKRRQLQLACDGPRQPNGKVSSLGLAIEQSAQRLAQQQLQTSSSTTPTNPILTRHRLFLVGSEVEFSLDSKTSMFLRITSGYETPRSN